MPTYHVPQYGLDVADGMPRVLFEYACRWHVGGLSEYVQWGLQDSNDKQRAATTAMKVRIFQEPDGGHSFPYCSMLAQTVWTYLDG